MLLEKEILETLESLYQRLVNDNHLYNYTINGRFVTFKQSVSNGTLNEKYYEVKNILSMYGGMGSLNDVINSGELKKLVEILYKKSCDLLRIYWRYLGNEFHEDDEYIIIPIGTKVKLINNMIMLHDSDQKHSFTYFERPEDKTVWEVVSNHYRDITNMVEYRIKNGATYQLARHTSLEICE